MSFTDPSSYGNNPRERYADAPTLITPVAPQERQSELPRHTKRPAATLTSSVPLRKGLISSSQSQRTSGWFSRLDRTMRITLLVGIGLLLIGTMAGGVVIGLNTLSNQSQPVVQIIPTATPTTGITIVPFLMPSPEPTVPPLTNKAGNCPAIPGGHDIEPAPPSSYCYDFNPYAPIVNLVYDPPPNFCQVMTLRMPKGNFRCHPNFAQQTGFVVLCVDDSWARADVRAHVNVVCSGHGGWEKDLYQHF